MPLTGHGGSSPPSDTTFALVNAHIVNLSGGLCQRIANRRTKQHRDLLCCVHVQPRDSVRVGVQRDAEHRPVNMAEHQIVVCPACPISSRSAACRFRCSLSAITVPLSRVTVRLPFAVFGVPSMAVCLTAITVCRIDARTRQGQDQTNANPGTRRAAILLWPAAGTPSNCGP